MTDVPFVSKGTSVLKSKQLACKLEMPIGIVKKLRDAVIASPIVENYIKEMLKA